METADPLNLVDHLDQEVIQARLDELARQRDALKVLLRAARARGKTFSASPPDGQEGARVPA
jgi:hypothetical protein